MSSAITVHLRVNDAATQRPTPVRLRLAGPGGEFFAPFGRVTDFPTGRNEAVGGHLYLGGKKYVVIDGSCEVSLPTGVPIDVEISKGPEYEPIQQTVTLGAGQMALRFTIARRFEPRMNGWLSADTRCHFLSPHDALQEAQAEGVSLAHLLATVHHTPANDGHLYRTLPNVSAFSGQQTALEANGHAVVVNTFNTHPALGRLGLLNSHRPVYPIYFGEENDDWSLGDWCNQCHRKKGLVVWADAYRSEMGLLGGQALAVAISGQVDVIEIDALERSQPFLPMWYRLLNAGIRLPLVGGSGKESNRHVLGAMRTYTQVGVDTSLAHWVERTRGGATFASNGPLLEIQVDGQPPGSLVTTEAKQKLVIRASAESLVPFDKLEIVCNGEVIASGGPSQPLEIEHELAKGGWLAARCSGSAKSMLDYATSLFAHSSPIWVRVADQALPVIRGAVRAALKDLAEVEHWIETVGHFTQPKRQAQILDEVREAGRVLEARLNGA